MINIEYSLTLVHVLVYKKNNLCYEQEKDNKYKIINCRITGNEYPGDR